VREAVCVRSLITLLALGLTAPLCRWAAAGEGGIDVEHCDLEAELLERSLRVKAELRARAEKLPKRWELVLADTMKVRSVTVGVSAVPFTTANDGLVLELAKVAHRMESPFHITVALEGAPYKRFSPQRGGFVRTALTQDIAYVRSQYPWYPRNGDDAATYRIQVRAPEGWQVRTAGRETAREKRGDAVVWTFEQARPCRRVGLVAARYRSVQAEAAGTPLMDALVPAGEDQGVQRLLDAMRHSFAHYGERLGRLERPRLTLVKMPEAYGPASGYCEDGYILVGKRPFEREQDLALVAHEVGHTWWAHEVAFSDFAAELLTSYVTLGFVEAEQGADAALRRRRDAVHSVVSCCEAGKAISMLDLRGFGGGQDPQTYEVHAYSKGMMILVMLEDALGRKKLDGILAKIVDAHRGGLYDYRGLRGDLMKAGGAVARRLLTQWEQPDLPTLEITYKARKGKVKGTLSQSGTRRPFQMDVTVRALCGDRHADTTVKLRGRKAAFALTAPAAPDAVVIDPEYRILAERVNAGVRDPEETLSKAIKEVVNNPGLADPAILKRTIATLRKLVAAGAGSNEGLCYTGIGRCLFRLGKLDEAREALQKALRLGVSPFHRQWTHLRLGCIADLERKRSEAEEHYRKTIAIKPGAFTAGKAQRFLKRPYRGYDRDQ
jgi:tetratricopeptide (TPR) repeat protein